MKGVLLPLTVVVLAVAAQPAGAAFPGTNGRIAMERAGANPATIATVNADGTDDRPAVIFAGPTDRDPSWSPDGRRLAFTSTRDGNEEIYVFDADTGGQTRLTFHGARDHDPSWSPDGTRIAFASERDGNPEIYVMAATPGAAAVRLTVHGGVDRQPTWSPSASIAFASDRGGDVDLYAMGPDGGGVMQITREPGPDVDPTWSPQGDRLAYTHIAPGPDWNVHVIGADGQNGRVLYATPGSEHFPAWSPDGTRIAVVFGQTAGASVVVIPAEGVGPGTFLTAVGRGTDPNWGPVPAPIGPPDEGRNVSATPLAGQVLIAPATAQPPSTDPVTQAQLRSPGELPTGSSINASRGTLAIEAITTTPDGPSTVGRAEVSGGVFTVSQRGAGEPTLRLQPGIRPCQRARIARVPPEARIRIRSRGRFRTIGGYGRASARGTDWAMRERCDGTVFRVHEGVVLVHDYRRRLSFRVRGGHCYLAAVRRRADALRPSRRCPAVGRRSR